ncbi:MAG: ATP-binding protein, partial [Candidatus Methanomethylophilaceae archaeon]|nr:ATP-binding protein [Candidatus Methanomethylophilaceae archaeon]
SLEEGRISVIYQDDGRGIDPNKQERIFEKGFGEGSGYGMFLSKEILSMTDFSIRETSRNGNGVRFEITGPPANFRLYS